MTLDDTLARIKAREAKQDEERRQSDAHPSWLEVFVRKYFNVGVISDDECHERMAESILNSLKTEPDGWSFDADDMVYHSYPQGLQYYTIHNDKMSFRILRQREDVIMHISHPMHVTLENPYANRIHDFLKDLAQVSKGDKNEFLVDHMEKNAYHLLELKKDSINYYDFIFWCYHNTKDSYFIDTEYKKSFDRYDRDQYDCYRIWFKDKEDGTTAKMLWG